MTDLIKQEVLTTAIFFNKDDKDTLEVINVVAGVGEKANAFIDTLEGDINKKKVRDTIRSYAAKLASSKTAIDKLRKEANAELNKQVKATNTIGNAAVADLQELQDKVRKPLTDWEDAEKSRVANHNYAIGKIRETGEFFQVNWQTAPIEDMESSLEEISAKDDGTWEEFNDVAVKLIKDTVTSIKELIEKRKQYDADQKELEELRKAKEEAEKKRREEELIELGKQQERERIEREKEEVKQPVQKVVKATHKAVDLASGKDETKIAISIEGQRFSLTIQAAIELRDNLNQLIGE